MKELNQSAKNLVASLASEIANHAIIGEIPPTEVMQEVRRKLVWRAMMFFNGNQTRVAEQFKTHRNTISRMLDRSGVSSRTGRTRKRALAG